MKLTLPGGVDAASSRVTLSRADDLEFGDIDILPPPGIARITSMIPGAAIDIDLDIRDGEGNPVLDVPAVVCLGVPSTYAEDEVVLLKNDGEAWEYLKPADPPSGFSAGAGNVAVCGSTDSFSKVYAVAAESLIGGAGRPVLISRIEPSIRDVRVSQGDSIRLSFDIYGPSGHSEQRARGRSCFRLGRRGRGWNHQTDGPCQRDRLHRSGEPGHAHHHGDLAGWSVSRRR